MSLISKKEFGKRLVCDIDANDVAEYQRKRLSAGVSNRTVNYEVGSLRGILRQFGLWGPIADRVRALPERHDVGRAVSAGDEGKAHRIRQRKPLSSTFASPRSLA